MASQALAALHDFESAPPASAVATAATRVGYRQWRRQRSARPRSGVRGRSRARSRSRSWCSPRSARSIWRGDDATRDNRSRSLAPIAVLLLVAVVFPPRFSHDLWSYAIVGRIVAVHHANPYLHPAGAFAADPLLRFVGPAWRRGTTPYGPLFAVQAAAVAIIGGTHPLLYRVAFQGEAAVAIGIRSSSCGGRSGAQARSRSWG